MPVFQRITARFPVRLRRHRVVLTVAAALAVVAAGGFTATAFAGDRPAVTSAVLLDATTNQPVPGRAPLHGVETLNLTALGTRELSVRAETSPRKVGSVRFEVDGRTTRVENHRPYVLNGDSSNGTDILPWTPQPGTHQLVITPYARAGAEGTAGAPVRIKLIVTSGASGSGPGSPPTSATPSAAVSTAPASSGPVAGAGIGGPGWSPRQLPPTQGGRQLYVSADGNDAAGGLTRATPLRTLQKAADLTQPGDTVVIDNGTYTAPGRQFVLGVTRSGTPQRWITYAAAPGARPKIKAAGWQGVAVNARYIRVVGLTVEGSTAQLTEQQKAAARSGNLTDPMVNTSCIAVAEPHGGGESTYPHHVLVYGNTVSGCPLNGISVMHADHVEVSHNIAYGNSNWSPFGGSGISMFQMWNSDSDADTKIIVRGNITHNNGSFVKCLCANFTEITDGGGIIIDSFDNRDSPVKAEYRGRTRIENNIAYNNGARGINAFRSSHIDIVNNTVYHNGSQESIKDNMIVNKATDVRVVNNILVGQAGTTAASVSAAENVTFDANLILGTTKVTDPRRLDVDPMFVDPDGADFRLRKGSPAVDSGTDTLAAQTDATTAARTGRVDRGALETR